MHIKRNDRPQIPQFPPLPLNSADDIPLHHLLNYLLDIQFPDIQSLADPKTAITLYN